MEARDLLRDAGIETSYLRLRALPISGQVRDFIARYERVYVVENNHDGQLYQILVSEEPGQASKLVSIARCNGLPLAARGSAKRSGRRREKGRAEMTTNTDIPTRAPKLNELGLDKTAYKAAPSTLCKGCGHDTISQRIMNVAWEAGLDQTQVIKLSGIGCSSKSPTYFLGWSHGFNSVHGRMPSVATGAIVANHKLTAIGVSGDGDTVSIGIGQFKHVVRRNVPMVYIVENNGVYGLTKGQFSATADMGQQLKYAGVNNLPPLDVCIEALAAGATFVARSFAGDPKQVEALLHAALCHRGIGGARHHQPLRDLQQP